MNRDAKLAAALAGLRDDLGAESLLATLPASDLAALTDAAVDVPTLKRWLKRRLAGEAVAHIRGGFAFDGRWFAVDKRAYVTDPELIHLVDAVTPEIQTLAARLGRAPLVAEVGVGCGSLALTLKARVPAADFVGLDLDPDALAVAAENSRRLALPLRLIEADIFEPWPADLAAPDLIYGDPPWGDAETLYGADRPAAHYAAMPPTSAFPLGGRTGVHAQILRAVARRGWTSELWLNGGVLPADEFAALGQLAARWQLMHPVLGLTIFRCHVV
jgi:methylase of polypeptide subunit release factors